METHSPSTNALSFADSEEHLRRRVSQVRPCNIDETCVVATAGEKKIVGRPGKKKHVNKECTCRDLCFALVC